MKKVTVIVVFVFISLFVFAQTEIVFISDTQKKTKAEWLISRPENNTRATDSLQAWIIRRQLSVLFHLGDITGIGSSTKNWRKAGIFFETLKNHNIPYYATPGNHEYMISAKKGKRNFEQHFGDLDAGNNINLKIIDSVAIMLVNSNFNKLTDKEAHNMLTHYNFIMDSLQQSVNIKCIIVGTHHAPFTNSRTIKPSAKVRNMLTPKYLKTPKAVLFLSGHAHLLELFAHEGKYFCVAGGGGGRRQARLKDSKERYKNLIDKEKRFRYFYCTVKIDADTLRLFAHGTFVGDWQEKTQEILTVKF